MKIEELIGIIPISVEISGQFSEELVVTYHNGSKIISGDCCPTCTDFSIEIEGKENIINEKIIVITQETQSDRDIIKIISGKGTCTIIFNFYDRDFDCCYKPYNSVELYD